MKKEQSKPTCNTPVNPHPIECYDFQRFDYDAETKSQRNRRYIAIATLLILVAGIVGYLIANP